MLFHPLMESCVRGQHPLGGNRGQGKDTKLEMVCAVMLNSERLPTCWEKFGGCI